MQFSNLSCTSVVLIVLALTTLTKCQSSNSTSDNSTQTNTPLPEEIKTSSVNQNVSKSEIGGPNADIPSSTMSPSEVATVITSPHSLETVTQNATESPRDSSTKKSGASGTSPAFVVASVLALILSAIVV